MKMGDQDSYHALMLDYAAGALPAASAILVETHFALRPKAALAAQTADIAGGAMLEELDLASVGAVPIEHISAGDFHNLEEEGGPEGPRFARDIIGAVIGDMDAAPWRGRPFGFRDYEFPVEGLSLLRLPGGRSAPLHGHGGEELTLVLHGRLEDETGAYLRGDIAFADEGLVHRPHVAIGPDCVCLISRDGPMKFRGLLGLVAALWPENPKRPKR